MHVHWSYKLNRLFHAMWAVNTTFYHFSFPNKSWFTLMCCVLPLFFLWSVIWSDLKLLINFNHFYGSDLSKCCNYSQWKHHFFAPAIPTIASYSSRYTRTHCRLHTLHVASLPHRCQARSAELASPCTIHFL